VAKNSLFGFRCHKLNPFFPLDMPRAQPPDRTRREQKSHAPGQSEREPHGAERWRGHRMRASTEKLVADLVHWGCLQRGEA
jgi:hypothetical protein